MEAEIVALQLPLVVQHTLLAMGSSISVACVDGPLPTGKIAGLLIAAGAITILAANWDVVAPKWGHITQAFQKAFDAAATSIVQAFNDIKIKASKKSAEGKSKKGKSNSKLPNQGTIKGDVKDAPAVDAGKQGKHVPGSPNYKEGHATWKPDNNGVHDTQEAWLNGEQLPDGTRVWDTGKTVGTKGETGVRVHIDQKGNIHGYPVNPKRYLPGK